MRARTRDLLAELHVNVSPDRLLEHVSAAKAQLVQVARALAFDCRVLVLDEPTTSLTDAEVDHLFRILDRLKARGVTIVFVSHRLPEVFRLCDRITVLRDGGFVGTYETARIVLEPTHARSHRPGDGRPRAADASGPRRYCDRGAAGVVAARPQRGHCRAAT